MLDTKSRNSSPLRTTCLRRMKTSRGSCRRAIAATILCLGLSGPAVAAIKSWNAASGSWGVAGNWTPVGVPGVVDTVNLGDLPGISNGTVTLGSDATIVLLNINDGMTLRTNTHSLAVSGVTTLTGQNVVGQTLYPSRLRVQQAVGFADFSTTDLNVSNSARVDMEGGAGMNIDGAISLNSGAKLVGSGIIMFSDDASPVLNNNGVIEVTDVGMSLFLSGAGRIDLDGSTGNGVISVDSGQGGSFYISHEGLTDAFSGEIHLTSDSGFSMALNEGWTADGNSLIDVEGTLDIGELPPSRIWTLNTATLMGDIHVGGFNGALLLEGEYELEPSLSVVVDGSDHIEFADEVTINGGTFTTGQGAAIDFNGPTTILGGTFNTFDAVDPDGAVSFNGPTTWAGGTVTINGLAHQNGNAVVASSTVINAGVFDMDGSGFIPVWEIDAPLTINCDSTANGGLDFFDGVMNLNGGLSAKLTINRSTGGGWVMNGVMNLAGLAGFFVDRVGGDAHIVGSGVMNISDSNAEISADMVFMPTNIVNFATPASDLRLRGRTILREDSIFNGQGTLQNGHGGEMSLTDTASLDEVGLINSGLLWISQYPNDGGQVLVDRFTNAAEGTLRVRVAGHTQGVEHDHWLVTSGGASIAGAIDVVVPFDPDETNFEPQVGDEFTILTAAGDVTGTFAANPVTASGAQSYHWSVEYGAHDVTLRLESTECNPCDVNCDGSINQFDIDPFIQTLITKEGCSPCAGDTNENGTTNQFDISSFLDCLTK